MNVANRFIVVLLSLLLIAAAGALIALAWDEGSFLNLEMDNFDLEIAVITDGLARAILTVVCGAIAALGVLFIMLQFVGLSGRKKERTMRLRQVTGDEVEISTDTIETMLRQEVEQLPEVKQAAVAVTKRKDSLESVIDLNLYPDAAVAHVTSETSHIVTESLRERLGLQLAKRPLIRVHYDELQLTGRSTGHGATYQPTERYEVEEQASFQPTSSSGTDTPAEPASEPAADGDQSEPAIVLPERLETPATEQPAEGEQAAEAERPADSAERREQ